METPAYITVPWAIVFTVCFSFWLYLRFFKADRTKRYIEPHEVKQVKKVESGATGVKDIKETKKKRQ